MKHIKDGKFFYVQKRIDENIWNKRKAELFANTQKGFQRN